MGITITKRPEAEDYDGQIVILTSVENVIEFEQEGGEAGFGFSFFARLEDREDTSEDAHESGKEARSVRIWIRGEGLSKADVEAFAADFVAGTECKVDGKLRQSKPSPDKLADGSDNPHAGRRWPVLDIDLDAAGVAKALLPASE